MAHVMMTGMLWREFSIQLVFLKCLECGSKRYLRLWCCTHEAVHKYFTPSYYFNSSVVWERGVNGVNAMSLNKCIS